MSKTYDRQTARFLAVIGENLPELSGPQMQGWIQRPKMLQNALAEALLPPNGIPVFKIWKTVKLGIEPKTVQGFKEALGGEDFDGIAEGVVMSGRFPISDAEIDLDLVAVTGRELGLGVGATFADAYANARKMGLQLCPVEVGPRVCMQYSEGPLPLIDGKEVRQVYFATEPIPVDPKVYQVGDGPAHLSADRYEGKMRMLAGNLNLKYLHHFEVAIFVLPRQAAL